MNQTFAIVFEVRSLLWICAVGVVYAGIMLFLLFRQAVKQSMAFAAILAINQVWEDRQRVALQLAADRDRDNEKKRIERESREESGTRRRTIPGPANGIMGQLTGQNVFLQATTEEDHDGFRRTWELILFFHGGGGALEVLTMKEYRARMPGGVLCGVPTDEATVRGFVEAANRAIGPFYRQWDSDGNEMRKGKIIAYADGTPVTPPEDAPATGDLYLTNDYSAALPEYRHGGASSANNRLLTQGEQDPTATADLHLQGGASSLNNALLNEGKPTG